VTSLPIHRAAVALAAGGLLVLPLGAHAQFIETELTAVFTDDGPTWSPDGTAIVFDSQRSGNLDLWHLLVADSSVTQLTFNAKADQNPAWSPDGSLIVYAAVDTTGLDLYTRPPAPGAATLLAADPSAPDRYPAWSPDGSSIAFEKGGDVYVIPATGGAPAQLTFDPALDGHPSWSPDGSQIVFRSNRSGSEDLWIMPSLGGAATQVTADSTIDGAPDWSPIGNLIAFHSDRSGTYDLWIVPATGGTPTQVTFGVFGDDFRPDWSPSGNSLAFSRHGGIWTVAFPVAGLSVTKDVDVATPSEGALVTYTVVAANAGPDAATGVEITDLLPTGVTLQSSSTTSGTYNAGNGIWTVDSLGVAEADTLAITAVVDSGTAGQTVTNLAALTALDQFDATTQDDADSAAVVIASVDLAVTKTVDDPAPVEGGTIAYTVTVANNGPDPVSGVELTDLLPAGVTYLSYLATQGTYTSGTGLWAVGSVPVAAVDTLMITATVDSGTAGLTITNVASRTASNETDSNAANDADSVGVMVTGSTVSAPAETLPPSYRLCAPRPNPFTAETSVVFDVPAAGRVRLSVYDVSGRLVRTLVRADLPAGRFQALWDGRDRSGRLTPAGVYLVRLEAGSFAATKKAVRLD
jgi:uncharacterized repeat protein (TIGR01451 family)